MSKEAVLAFRDKMTEDEELQELIQTGLQDGNLNLVLMGKTHGFDFTAAELDDVWNSLQGGEGELTDFELEVVSGGGVSGTPGQRETAEAVIQLGLHMANQQDEQRRKQRRIEESIRQGHVPGGG